MLYLLTTDINTKVTWRRYLITHTQYFQQTITFNNGNFIKMRTILSSSLIDRNIYTVYFLINLTYAMLLQFDILLLALQIFGDKNPLGCLSFGTCSCDVWWFLRGKVRSPRLVFFVSVLSEALCVRRRSRNSGFPLHSLIVLFISAHSTIL